MDPDDEYDWKLLKDFYKATCADQPSRLKLHGNEIIANIRTYHDIANGYGRASRVRVSETEHGHTIDELDQLSTCRGRLGMSLAYRFFDAISGHHNGTLDLAGRHPERYARLRQQFNIVEQEFMEISQHCTAPQRRKRLPGLGLRLLDPPDVWVEFAAKWRLGDLMGWDDIRVCIKDCRAAMTRNPEPLYQKLLLLDLPAELLDHVMTLSTRQELRLWSATSKLLREHAFGYIYQSLFFVLTMKGGHALFSSQDCTEEEAMRARYQWAAQRCRKMEQRISHVLHPDIICRPRELQFVDEFRMVVGGLSNWMGCSHTTLLRTILMRLADVINFAPLKTLVFVSRIVPLYLWAAIINNETLRTIHLEAGLGSTGSIWPDAPQIRNLLITIRNDKGAEGARRVIGLCPSLAFLNVISADADTPISNSIVRPISQCLDRSLRRLHLYGIDPSAVSSLARTLKSAAAPLPLTHLSLTSAEWTHLKRNCVLRLIRGLRNLPHLRVLCLRGLQYTQPGLFGRIARFAPRLQALTVGHRVSILEATNPFYGARWPAPAYEYAKYLTGMRELRHLGINMELQGRAYSPAGLLGFERRMSEPEIASSLDESDPEDEIRDPDDYLTRDSARHTAAMFAAYAPALQSFFAGSEEDWVPMFSCTFSRKDGGGIAVNERPSESEVTFGIEAAGGRMGVPWDVDGDGDEP